jgi:hypothetical protein
MLKLQENIMNTFNKLYKGPLLVFTFSNHLTGEKQMKTLEHYVKNRKNTYFFNEIPDIFGGTDLSIPEGHPSAKGYNGIAKSLVGYLSNKIIPCNK